MKRSYLFSILLIGVCLLFGYQLKALINDPSPEEETQETQLYVKFKSQEAFEQTQIYANEELWQQFGITQFERPFKTADEQLQTVFLVTFSKAAKKADLIEKLESLQSVEYVEEPGQDELFFTPTDLQTNQWNLTKVQAELAWDISQGSNDVIIAIIDDAIETTHPDLAGNIWQNADDPVGNGDEDNNGYIDDYQGWDFANNDNDPNPPNSNFDHGTHVAGIASAVTNNGTTGIAGAGFKCKIMPLKVASSNSSSGRFLNGTAIDLALSYAINNGADVINMSFGSSGISSTRQLLLNNAHAQGIVLVAAAGNSNTNALFYPASATNVISVGATAQSDAKANFSNYGSAIDVMAPGVAIYSTLTGGQYGNKQGTSMAAPLVAGIAALMKSHDYTLTPNQVESCIKSSAVNIDAQNASYVGQIGAGRLDAFGALTCVTGPPVAYISADQTTVCPNVNIQFSDNSTREPSSWLWTFPGGTPGSSTQENPVVSYASAGIYDVTLAVTNASGTTTTTFTNYITIGATSTTVTEGCPPDTVIYNDTSSCETVFNYSLPSTWIDCGNSVSYLNNFTSGSSFPLGTTTVCIKVSAGDPIDTCKFDVTVLDTIPPNAICQDVVIQLDSGGSIYLNPIDFNNGSSDNCSIDTITLSQSTIDSCAVDTVILTVTDNSGNSSTCTATVTGATNSELICNCYDGLDNDGDGYTDEFDSDCPNYAPILCDNRFFMTLENGGAMRLYEAETNPVQLVEISNLNQNGVIGEINAIGHNPVDNFIYGINRNSPHRLFRVNANGNAEVVGNVSGLISQMVAGAFDANGNYYVSGATHGRLFKIDINTLTSVEIGSSNGQSFSDFAFNPVDGLLYGFDQGHGIKAIDVTNNTVAYTAPPTSDFNTFGTSFTSEFGKYYGYGGVSSGLSQNTLVEFDIVNGTGIAIGTGPSVSISDGCSCPFGLDLTKEVLITSNVNLINNVPTVAPPNTITYRFTLMNQTGAVLNGIDFNDVLTNGFIWASDPYNQTNLSTSLGGTIVGSSAANFTINNVALNNAAYFDIDVTVPDSCFLNLDYLNQAFITNLPAAIADTILSDDPITTDIDDPTLLRLVPKPTHSIVLTDSCDTIGGIDLTPINTNNQYSYLWSTGDTTQDLTGLTSGTYTVTITDSSGCVTVQTFTMTFPVIHQATIVVDSLLCDSFVTLGLQNTYAFYLWSTGATTPTITVYNDGKYWVTAIDDSGCIYIDTVDLVFNNGGLTASFELSDYNGYNVSCRQANDGFIITTINSTFSASYSWSTGLQTPNVTSAGAGVYILTVSDGLCGFKETFAVSLTQPTALTVTETISSCGDYEICCAGETTGSIDLAISGSVPPYTVLWSTGATTTSLSNLAAGSYSYTVTDLNGCTSTNTIDITEPEPLTGTINVVSDYNGSHIRCHNSPAGGRIETTVSGGVEDYTYLWSTDSPTVNLAGVGAGIYTVTITDENGCQLIMTDTIVAPDSITVTTIGTNTPCTDSIGSVAAFASGGTPGAGSYEHLWYLGDICSGTGSALFLGNTGDISVIDQLACGTYGVVVLDANGCVGIGKQDVLCIDTVAPVLSDCPDDTTIVLTDTCTTVVSWTPPTATDNCSGVAITCNICLDQNGQVALDVGTHIITYYATDSSGNVDSCSFTVTITGPPMTVSGVVTNTTCQGGNDGAIDVTVSGGCPPYVYSWNTGASTEDLTGLGAGVYVVTVTDAGGSQQNAAFTVGGPAVPMTADVLVGPLFNGYGVSCNGASDGTVRARGNDGLAPYTYLWNTGATTKKVDFVSAGTYSVTVTDANGCTAAASGVVTEPTSLSLSASITDVDCNGNSTGAIDLTVSGSVSPYTYAWSNSATTQDISALAAGTYTVTVTDLNGCTATSSYVVTEPTALAIVGQITDATCSNSSDGAVAVSVTGGTPAYSYLWSNGHTTANNTGLPSGSHSVTVTDANGCTIQSTYEVSAPPALTLSWITKDVTCNGDADGALKPIVSGGTSPYTYLWSTGSTANKLQNLSGGTYTVTITDANGCQIIDSETVNEPGALIADGYSVDVSCNGGSDGQAIVDVTAGTQPYSYSWSTGATTAIVNNLAPGTYTVTVTDDNGCTATATSVVGEPAALGISGTVTDVLCNGGATGAIDITVSGGTAAYTFAWSNSATTEDINSLAVGNYVVTVTDNNGCTTSAGFTVGEPSVLSLSGVVSDVNCVGGNDGSINLTVSGGTAPYTFAWSNSATTEDVSGLTAAGYIVTVTDDNGCTATASFTVNESGQIMNNSTITHNDCNGQSIGAIDITPSGATGPYTFVWSNGPTTEDISGLAAGSYTVTISSPSGCSRAFTYHVNEPTQLSVVAVATDITCYNLNNGVVDALVTGGTSPYTYAWSNGGTGQDIGQLSDGTYTVTVTDDNGCTASASATVNRPPDMDVNVQAIPASCFGGSDGEAHVTVTGGTTPYSIIWPTGETTFSIYNLSYGNYVSTVTDANNCTWTATAVINHPYQLQMTLFSSSNESCPGESDGHLNVSVSGGTIGYSFLWSSGQTASSISNISAGTYSLTATDSNGCTIADTFTVGLDNPTCPPAMMRMEPEVEGIHDVTELTEEMIDGATSTSTGISVRTSPNPFIERLRIEIDGLEDTEAVNLYMINSTGSAVYQNMLVADKPKITTIIDTREMKSGVYFVVVSNATERKTLKVVKLDH